MENIEIAKLADYARVQENIKWHINRLEKKANELNLRLEAMADGDPHNLSGMTEVRREMNAVWNEARGLRSALAMFRFLSPSN